MKEATGELNMTVITVIAIAAIAALFYAFIWPMIQRTIVQNTCNTYGVTAAGVEYKATKISADQVKELGGVAGSTSEKTSNWACCPGGNYASTGENACIAAE